MCNITRHFVNETDNNTHLGTILAVLEKEVRTQRMHQHRVSYSIINTGTITKLYIECYKEMFLDV